MTTQLVRDTIKVATEHGTDPTEIYWFDATGCLKEETEFSQDHLHLNRPPFQKCMVCWQGTSDTHGLMTAWLYLSGDDPEEGIIVRVWRKPPGSKFALANIPIVYFVQDGLVHYKALNEKEVIKQEDAEMILGFIGAWYESMSRRVDAYIPSVQKTFTNRRKIAQGKVPIYEWRTVTIEPTKPRQESQGGTHASPRQHDRRGHLRRLASGKTVWVRHCKVGHPNKGVIYHDYKVAA